MLTTFNFVIITSSYTICILYLHIKIVHVSIAKRKFTAEPPSRVMMRENHCILFAWQEEEKGLGKRKSHQNEKLLVKKSKIKQTKAKQATKPCKPMTTNQANQAQA